MARKKSERKPKNLGEAVGFKNIVSNEKTDFLLGVIILFLAIYTIIATVSYLSTGQADQSLLESLRPGEWLNTEHEFTNYCGSIGAILAHNLVTVNFGLPSFLIPAFLILAALKLMGAYKVNLWKWFFGTMLVMVWSSVTFAKFLTPIISNQIYNPGGNHGLYCVQHLENVIGPPGLTAVLLIVALAFLTYLSAETISIIRKALNPIGYITSKIKVTVTNNHPEKDIEKENKDFEEDSPKENNEPVKLSTVIDLTPDPETNKKRADQNVPMDQPETPATEPGITVELAKTEETAKGKTLVSDEIDLNSPINPREPFLRYKFPTLALLKTYDNDGRPEVDMDEIKANNAHIVKVLNLSLIHI